MNRRQILKRTGLAGMGSLGVFTSNASAEGSGHTTEIEVVKHGDEVRVTEEVPVEWYNRVKQSRVAARRLRKRFGDEDWFLGVGRPATEKSVGGLKKLGVQAVVKDAGRAKRDLPDAVEDLDVGFEEGKDPEPAAYWCNNTTYNCVHGGSHLTVEQFNNSGQWTAHSAGCIVRHDDVTRLLTCSHGFNDDSCGWNIYGNRVYQGAADQWVGRAVDWDYSQDWAVVDIASNAQIAGLSNTILYSGGYPIYGRTSQDGIDMLASNNTTVYKYGARTCESTGGVIGEYWWEKCYHNEPWVHTTNHFDHGDSGGPCYWYYKYDGQWWLAIVGTLYGWTAYDNAAWGSAWKAHQDHGINYGWWPTC